MKGFDRILNTDGSIIVDIKNDRLMNMQVIFKNLSYSNVNKIYKVENKKFKITIEIKQIELVSKTVDRKTNIFMESSNDRKQVSLFHTAESKIKVKIVLFVYNNEEELLFTNNIDLYQDSGMMFKKKRYGKFLFAVNFRVVDREYIEIGNLVEHSLFMTQLSENEQLTSQRPDWMVLDEKLIINLVKKTPNSTSQAIIENKMCTVTERNQSDTVLVLVCSEYKRRAFANFNVEFANASLILRKLSLEELSFNLKIFLPNYATSNGHTSKQQKEMDATIDKDLEEDEDTKIPNVIHWKFIISVVTLSLSSVLIVIAFIAIYLVCPRKFH